MNAVALTLLLGTALPAQAPQPENLDFGTGTLAGWRGHGFYVTTADPRGPSRRMGVCGCDRGPSRTGTLRYTFVVPPGAGVLLCSACACCRKGLTPDDRLDVVVLTEGSEVLPKQVKGPRGWEKAEGLLPRRDGRAREYRWEVGRLVGRRVQILLSDDDPRPGCYVFCGGFRLAAADDLEEREFAARVRRLEREKGLAPLSRFASRHFVAWSNAEENFTKKRLRNCEIIYQLVFEHFRRRGFAVQRPPAKLMVAVFDTQTGFEAFLGIKLPSAVTGVYMRDTNQLVVYDLSQNAGVVAGKQKAINDTRGIWSDQDKRRYLETVHRHLGEWMQDASVSTAIHETAHHLSFNCGLLNRTGDVPAWLSEGLACYCEPTDQGRWQGIGESNPGRAGVLAVVVERKWPFIPLRVLLEQDAWRFDSRAAVLGYSQSWALFRYLMQQRPAQLRTYLQTIYDRRAPDHRLADFGEAFGSDLARFEQRYFDYLRALARQAPRR
jgi:hypothetical protein